MSSRCLADLSGPFYDTAKPFRNWSSLPFYQMDLDAPPYVDRVQLDAGVDRAIAHARALRGQGYTGVVMDNMAHLVGFVGTPAAYAAGSPYAARASIYAEAFGRLFAALAAMGMEVFITSDMQWMTPPLRQYVGRLHRANPRIAQVNRWAIEELFARFPQVSGLVIRVGEAGGAHDAAGYTGHLLYRTPAALRELIGGLLPVCERAQRLLVVRTWTIGIGKLGNLLWSPAQYRAVFGDMRSPSLLVSIKHGPADFFRTLPPNPTLGLPGPQQIIELQNRREYELFGMVPNSIAALHQGVLARAASSASFAGVWAWNATGGWGGGTAALGEGGWSLWTEISSAVTAALARDPSADTGGLIQAWCVERFGADVGPCIATAYEESAELFGDGWYLPQQAVQSRMMGGIYLPALLWVWWMRPTAAPLVWALLAALAGDSAQAVARAERAQRRVAEHAQAVAACASAHPQAAFAAESLRYMAGVFGVALAIRRTLLPLFAAAHAQDRARWDVLTARAGEARAVLRAHREAWGVRADFPALELAEVDAYLVSLGRHPRMAWAQARASALAVQRMAAAPVLRRSAPVAQVLVAALLGLGVMRARSNPAQLVWAAALLALLPAAPWLVRQALPWLNRRYFLLPSIFLEAGPALSEWAA
ncbi:hypothetical protein F8S13_02075 [Chloroflexia bacterium SDU3-3]|nr:hypothetical protein F8S13_02075 [Chloroflexia bacterium SDU3-3]